MQVMLMVLSDGQSITYILALPTLLTIYRWITPPTAKAVYDRIVSSCHSWWNIFL